jgi:hypothetical protein
MFDDFEYNPTVEIIAAEFTFNQLDPELALHVAEVLAHNIGYSGLRDARWYFAEYEGKPSLRAEHRDQPIKADFKTVATVIDQMRKDTERLFETYNKVLGVNIDFDGIGVHFSDSDDLPDMD